MSIFIHRMLGHYLMNEAATDGTQSAGATTTASAEQEASQAATTEQQTAATDQGQQQAGQQDSSAAAVPESYTFVDLPEGYSLEGDSLAEVTGAFKELGLTQDQAQKLVEMDAKRQLAGAQQAQEAQQRQVGEWVESLKQDAEFGGAKFDENVAVAQKAMATFGTAELKQMLEESGLGSHPEVVRFFHRVGSQMSEGKLHRSTTEQPQERSIAERMYPNYGK